MYLADKGELYKYRPEQWASKPVADVGVPPARMFAVGCGGEPSGDGYVHLAPGTRRDTTVAPRDLTPAGLVLNEEVRYKPATR